MSIVRLGVVAFIAAAAILGFKKVRRSRGSEALAPVSDMARDESNVESSWPVASRS
ncbi:MAG TPA: hypothetical protein VGO78_29790 [Acidimicrobiales bacterium]|nr:hypothetical protein [Acidimicrobiales bacterium]